MNTNTVPSPDEVPETFTHTLVGDVTVASERARSSEDDESKRNLIRTIFAAVEGLNWQLRESLLESRLVVSSLTHHEIAALAEETYSVTERGEVLAQPRFIPLAASIRMVVRIVAKVRPHYSLDYNHVGWSHLKKSIEVRNRIVHPKKLADLHVTKDEAADAIRAFHWFLAYVIEVMRELVEHLQVKRAALPRPAERGASPDDGAAPPRPFGESTS